MKIPNVEMEIIFINLSIFITIFLFAACDYIIILYITHIEPIRNRIENYSSIDFEPAFDMNRMMMMMMMMRRRRRRIQHPNENVYYTPRTSITKIYCNSVYTNNTLYRIP
jgi:hypothetical protein